VNGDSMTTSTARAAADDSPLEGSVARLEAILASTLDPIVIIDAFGMIQSVSDSIHRVFGYQPDELIGRNVNVLMPEPHRSMHDTYLARYRQTGQTHILGRTREFDVLKKDGTLFPIELSISRVDVPGRDEPLFCGIIHDISERKSVERERVLLQHLAIGISSANDLDTALVTALTEICNATGWDYGEAWLPTRDGRALVAGPYWQHPERSLAEFRAATCNTQFGAGQGLPGRVLVSRQPEWLTSLDPPESDRFLRSDAARQAGLRAGFAVPILVGEAVVAVIAFFAHEQHEEDPHLLELVAAATAPLGPVIQRRRAEEALIESERRFREMLNNVQLVAVMLDHNGTITFCDNYLLKLTGYSHRDEVVGRNWFELFIPESTRSDLLEKFRQWLSSGEIAPHYENDIITRDGQTRRIAWSNSLMRGPDSKVIGATALGVDVTEQRRIEAELELHRTHLERLVAQRTADLKTTHEQLRMADRLASIGTLTAGLGHDMNNMLLPMRCRLDAIDQMDISAGLREHISAIRSSVDYLQQLTDGLQLFALDPEDEAASNAVTDIRAWWAQVGPLLSRAVARSAEFTAYVPDDLPPAAVPSHRLTQAALNLIVNAGEAIDGEGRVQFRVSVVEDGKFVRLRVIDNGCGMSDEIKQRVLEPFFTTKKRGLGTGLGLALVRGVVSHAGGSIKIDSEPGRGTMVTLLLPVARTAASSPPIENQRDRLTATVSISDPRVATFLVVLLQGADVNVELTSPHGAPDTNIWILEGHALDARSAAVFLHREDRRVIVYQPSGRLPEHENVAVINEPDNFEAIRRTIIGAVDGLSGCSRRDS
jgi:PAS domain S-box-containing protein